MATGISASERLSSAKRRLPYAPKKNMSISVDVKGRIERNFPDVVVRVCDPFMCFAVCEGFMSGTKMLSTSRNFPSGKRVAEPAPL